jgi:hypothetical protein
MDQLFEFFKGLDTFQWVLLAGGLFLLWPTIQEKLGGLVKTDGGDVQPEPEPQPSPDNGHNHDLTALVEKWECLCDCCHEHGLHNACDKLQEVFPMLVKPYEKHKDESKAEDH